MQTSIPKKIILPVRNNIDENSRAVTKGNFKCSSQAGCSRKIPESTQSPIRMKSQSLQKSPIIRNEPLHSGYEITTDTGVPSEDLITNNYEDLETLGFSEIIEDLSDIRYSFRVDSVEESTNYGNNTEYALDNEDKMRVNIEEVDFNDDLIEYDPNEDVASEKGSLDGDAEAVNDETRNKPVTISSISELTDVMSMLLLKVENVDKNTIKIKKMLEKSTSTLSAADDILYEGLTFPVKTGEELNLLESVLGNDKKFKKKMVRSTTLFFKTQINIQIFVI